MKHPPGTSVFWAGTSGTSAGRAERFEDYLIASFEIVKTFFILFNTGAFRSISLNFAANSATYMTEIAILPG